MCPYYIYPDAPTPEEIVAKAEKTFSIVLPPPIPPSYDVFVRFVMSGSSLDNQSGNPNHPTISLNAGTDPMTFKAIPVGSSGNEIKYNNNPVANVSLEWKDNNVYLMTVSIFGSVPSWQIKIKNNDQNNARQFVWVSSNVESQTQQPWIDVSPLVITLNPLANQSMQGTIEVSNHGTTAFTVVGLNPPLSANFQLLNAPFTVPPNSPPQKLLLRYTASSIPATHATNTTVSVVSAPVDSKATTSAGHNKQVIITTIPGELPSQIAAKVLSSKRQQLISDGFRASLNKDPNRRNTLRGYRATAACMRDASYVFDIVVEACRQDSPAPIDNTFPALSETLYALGAGASWYRDILQYIRNNHGLTDAPATVANFYFDRCIQYLK